MNPVVARQSAARRMTGWTVGVAESVAYRAGGVAPVQDQSADLVDETDGGDLGEGGLEHG
jgi:hypothetical protein